MSVDRDTASPYAPPPVPVLPRPVASPVGEARTVSSLRTLAVFHHLLGALSLAGALGWGAFLAFGIAQEAADGFADPAGLGMIAMIGVVVAASLAGGMACIWAGLQLARPARLGACTTIAALACLSFPLGTALGIATLVTLQRPDVRAAFAQPSRA